MRSGGITYRGLGLLAVLCAGCSGAVHTLDVDMAALHDDLEAGRFDKAYTALAAGQQQAIGPDEFVQALKQDPALAEGLIALVEKALEQPQVTYRARITLEDGTEIVLALVEGSWVFETPVTSFYGQGTPREALISFVEAFEAQRWDVVAALVPSSYSTGDDETLIADAWTDPSTSEDIARLVKLIEVHVNDEIVIQGNRATLVYPEGQVTFLREGGKWVILDLD